MSRRQRTQKRRDTTVARRYVDNVGAYLPETGDTAMEVYWQIADRWHSASVSVYEYVRLPEDLALWCWRRTPAHIRAAIMRQPS